MPDNRSKSGKKANATSFKPGQSGNPGGRPKLRELVRERSAKAVDEHVVEAWIQEVVTRGDDWVKCSELLAAYGIGKPQSAPEDLEAVTSAQPVSRDLVVQALEGLAKARDGQ